MAICDQTIPCTVFVDADMFLSRWTVGTAKNPALINPNGSTNTVGQSDMSLGSLMVDSICYCIVKQSMYANCPSESWEAGREFVF